MCRGSVNLGTEVGIGHVSSFSHKCTALPHYHAAAEPQRHCIDVRTDIGTTTAIATATATSTATAQQPSVGASKVVFIYTIYTKGGQVAATGCG